MQGKKIYLVELRLQKIFTQKKKRLCSVLLLQPNH